MGNPKQKWTAEEEEALRAGVAKHGTGKWKNIQRDPEFNPFLFSRSNIDLKDKWRNMSVSAPREKSRTLKPKAGSDAPAVPLSTPQTSALPAAVPIDASADPITDESARSSAPKYNALIFEAISALKEPNGSDVSAILSYIEQRLEVPPNFRRLLSSRLRRPGCNAKAVVHYIMILQVQNCFKVKEDASLGTKTPNPKQKDTRPKLLHSTNDVSPADTVQEAAAAAAGQVADAENKSFVAAEAVKEAERVSRMAEDTDSLLQLAKEIFERCSRGEIVVVA
ncbi:Single myb histone 4 [Citrus sinensis]|uniref:Single myb histone 4 n=1 Tax=Citrus sinensis TaxID=2711 RepID=A0ACB8NUL8_CITSI|nr:Single myb histone 4 [Citrus sinensis]